MGCLKWLPLQTIINTAGFCYTGGVRCGVQQLREWAPSDEMASTGGVRCGEQQLREWAPSDEMASAGVERWLSSGRISETCVGG